jgi:hypothetical protein
VSCFLERKLPAVGAALIETPKQAADCRVIRRNWLHRAPGGGDDPRAFAAPKKQRPTRLRDRFPLGVILPQRSDLALLLLGDERPMVAGSNCDDQQASVSRLRYQGFGFHLSHHQPMRELNDKV